MTIGINSVLPQQTKQSLENMPSREIESRGTFLSVAKKVFSIFAPVPAEDADKAALAHFKKIKETSRQDKKRTEEDALHDIEKLLRRVEKSKRCGKQNGSR
ncbi:MAG: hypothetical protein WC527_06140 [Candidatus Margulisiibacteriota bacterium]